MKIERSFSIACCVLLAFAIFGSAVRGSAEVTPLPTVDPERQNISSERLKRVAAMSQRYIDRRQHAGLVTLLARDGKIVDWRSHGFRNVERRLPMECDTICRIYSMTKIVTSVAALILIEEGRLGLDQPVAQWLPELAKPRVLTGGTADAPIHEETHSAITIRHLLTHTAGYTYDFIGHDPIHELYTRKDLWNSASPEDFVRRVAALPLAHHPGAQFTYGINVDLLGAAIEKASGETLERFFAIRILGPLGMVDTAFDVPAEKLDRLATVYTHGAKGGFAEPPVFLGAFAEQGRGFASGGGGLFSTAGDLARFAQMLLNGGALDGHRIVSRKTIELMIANHLQGLPGGCHALSPAHGFGLGVEVRLDLGKGGPLGSPGQFGWYGAATTYCAIDPKERLVTILLAQHLPFNEHGIFDAFANAYFQALE